VVVAPPAIASSYSVSCMFNPSMLLKQGIVGALYEFLSLMPFGQSRRRLKTKPAAQKTQYPPFKPGTVIMLICKSKSTGPGVTHFPPTSTTAILLSS